MLWREVFSYCVQGCEDYSRHQADKEVNESDTIIIKDGEEKHIKSKDIKVCLEDAWASSQKQYMKTKLA